MADDKKPEETQTAQAQQNQTQPAATPAANTANTADKDKNKNKDKKKSLKIPGAPSGNVRLNSRIIKDIKAIADQGRGTSNGNFGMDLVIMRLPKGSNGPRRVLHKVNRKNLVRFDVTKDFLTSFTDYMVIEFQISAREFRNKIIKNKSCLMAQIKFGIIDHETYGKAWSEKKKIHYDTTVESVNTWWLSAYVLETQNFENLDPYADNISDEDLDKVGMVKCKLQLVFPEYEVLNTWCTGLQMQNVTMFNVLNTMIGSFMKEKNPMIFGRKMNFNRRIENPDNAKTLESVTTSDFILDPTQKDAKVPSLLNMLYNTQEMYGTYTSGICVYVYRELNRLQKSFEEAVANEEKVSTEEATYTDDNVVTASVISETSLLIARGIRPVPVPLPYPVDYDYSFKNTEGGTVAGEYRNINVMYDKVSKSLGGKIIRVFVCPPDPSVAISENTFGCLCNDVMGNGIGGKLRNEDKKVNYAKYSLDIIANSKPVVASPTHDFIGQFPDQDYFPKTGNYQRLTDNTVSRGIKTHATGAQANKYNASLQEVLKEDQARRKKEEEEANANAAALAAKQEEENKKREEEEKKEEKWYEWLYNKFGDGITYVVENGKKLAIQGGKVIAEYAMPVLESAAETVKDWAVQALDSFWGIIQKFYTNSAANIHREQSLNYMLSTIKMVIEWKHSNPWLICPQDVTEVIMEDDRGTFHYLGSITSVAWSYDFSRQSANAKLQFMGKLSHIQYFQGAVMPNKPQTTKKEDNKAKKKASTNAAKPTAKTTTNNTTTNTNKKQVKTMRQPRIPLPEE